MSGVDNGAMRRSSGHPGLETPRGRDLRAGLSQTSLIGRRLSRVYDVAADVPREMNQLLQTLNGKGAR